MTAAPSATSFVEVAALPLEDRATVLAQFMAEAVRAADEVTYVEERRRRVAAKQTAVRRHAMRRHHYRVPPSSIANSGLIRDTTWYDLAKHMPPNGWCRGGGGSQAIECLPPRHRCIARDLTPSAWI